MSCGGSQDMLTNYRKYLKYARLGSLIIWYSEVLVTIWYSEVYMFYCRWIINGKGVNNICIRTHLYIQAVRIYLQYLYEPVGMESLRHW